MTHGALVDDASEGLLEFDDAPYEHELLRLDERLDASLVDQTGHGDGQPLAIVARDDDGHVVAGVHGLTWGGCCELMTLWVDEDQRRRGIATRLLDEAEAEARRRRCSQMVLFTHSLRPPPLYLRVGYEVVGVMPDYPRGSSAYWLRKCLLKRSERTPLSGCNSHP